jgi:hypothetical protein
MKKQLLNAFAHPAALPAMTALYGVAAGYLVGTRRAAKNPLVEGGDVTVEEALANPDQFTLRFPDMEAEESLSFDNPPAKKELLEPAEEVSPEDRSKIMKHLGRITEVKEEGDETVVTMELDEEGARLKAEADAELEARTAMSIYAAAEPEAETEIENIFTTPAGEWNYDEEVRKRGDRDPYVIHADEYHSEESKFRQATLTYYAGDDVMTDEDDQPVFNFEEIIGPLMWGHGSNNGDLFYARNPRLEAEYEIARSYESYAHAILGIEAEAKASAEEVRHSRRLPRLSQDD